MLILSLLLLTDPSIWRIHVVSEVENYGDIFIAAPDQLSRGTDHLVLVDRDYRLWFIDFDGQVRAVVGGRGEGPGEFQARPDLRRTAGGWSANSFRGMPERARHFDFRGRLVKPPPDLAVSQSKHLTVGGDRKNVNSPATVRWSCKDGTSLEEILGDENDPTLWSRYSTVHGDGFTLVHNNHSLDRTLYYLVLKDNQCQPWDKGQDYLRDSRNREKDQTARTRFRPGRSKRVLQGVTYSSLGFAMTEMTRESEYRILRLYNPSSRRFSFRKVVFGKEQNLYFFQHLNQERWAAYDDKGALLFFDMLPGQ